MLLGCIAILVFDIHIGKYYNITSSGGLTVLLECFDLFIDLVLQVPDFYLSLIFWP